VSVETIGQTTFRISGLDRMDFLDQTRLNILVVGATGLIGAAVAARLQRDGHHVIGVARTKLVGSIEVQTLDLARKSTDWAHILSGIDVVINCAGALQDGPRDDLYGVHLTGPSALFRACEEMDVRRVIHFSAIGVDRGQPSEFSRSKHQAEATLIASKLDWVILRPSVVIGPRAYGASAMLRGLAALPVLPLMPSTGKLQVVHLHDVVETVVRLVSGEMPARLVLDLAGPQQLEFSEVVAAFRSWLGWRPAKHFNLPQPVATAIYHAGDFAGRLGWRPPIRSTASLEIVRGATGDPSRWMEITGIAPMSIAQALSADPAGVQERWFARLYFLKPLAIAVLSLFWLLTGVISLTVGWQLGINLMSRTPISMFAEISVITGALADIVVGILIIIRRTSYAGLLLGIMISLAYAAAGTLLLPELWKEPLGPLLKIWPILVLHLMTIAVLEER
jgi:uncharacterized protein YbjT (DUF2867 family)